MAARQRPDHAPGSPPASGGRDFHDLRETGERAGVGLLIGRGFGTARDTLARGLLRLGATPNHITFVGFLMTAAAGFCLARGAGQQVPYFYAGHGPVGWWPLAAGVFLLLSAACDMLDGAVARLGNCATTFGALLDSTLDRLSDMAIYVGCAVYFALAGNLTYQLLSLIALCAAVMTSYVKARAENVIDDCSVGYWLRGERYVGILVGCFAGHMPALLWQQSLTVALTVYRRVDYARRVLASKTKGTPPPRRWPRRTWRSWLRPWRHPRGSIPHDLISGFNIAYIILAARFWPALLATGPFADPLMGR
ncbi:MAG: CDP-alcohol phosphatidyltransferase family protein [Phycisphaerae bacterium]|jgi:CDP-diacylglycerol--glycerol-3-phosphate 3-phosphatidyltransferase